MSVPVTPSSDAASPRLVAQCQQGAISHRLEVDQQDLHLHLAQRVHGLAEASDGETGRLGLTEAVARPLPFLIGDLREILGHRVVQR